MESQSQDSLSLTTTIESMEVSSMETSVTNRRQTRPIRTKKVPYSPTQSNQPQRKGRATAARTVKKLVMSSKIITRRLSPSSVLVPEPEPAAATEVVVCGEAEPNVVETITPQPRPPAVAVLDTTNKSRRRSSSRKETIELEMKFLSDGAVISEIQELPVKKMKDRNVTMRRKSVVTVVVPAGSPEIDQENLNSEVLSELNDNAMDVQDLNLTEQSDSLPLISVQNQTHDDPPNTTNESNIEEENSQNPNDSIVALRRNPKRKRRHHGSQKNTRKALPQFEAEEEVVGEVITPEFEELDEGLIYDDGNTWEKNPPPVLNKVEGGRGILRSCTVVTSDSSQSSSSPPVRKKLRVAFTENGHHTRFYHSPTLFAKRNGLGMRRKTSKRHKITPDDEDNVELNDSVVSADTLTVKLVGETGECWSPKTHANIDSPVTTFINAPVTLFQRNETSQPEIVQLPSLGPAFNHPEIPKSSQEEIEEFLPFPEAGNCAQIHDDEFAGALSTLSSEDSEPEPESNGMYVNSEVHTDCVNPIFEMLQDCKHPISNIVPELLPGAMSAALHVALDRIGIETIGQFALLTRGYLLTLPISSPRIEHTLQVLERYHTELMMTQQNEHAQVQDYQDDEFSEALTTLPSDRSVEKQESNEMYVDSETGTDAVNTTFELLTDCKDPIINVPQLTSAIVKEANGDALKIATRTLLNAMTVEERKELFQEFCVVTVTFK